MPSHGYIITPAMKHLFLLFTFACLTKCTSAQLSLTGTFSNTNGNRYEIFLKEINPESVLEKGAQWQTSTGTKNSFKLKAPLSKANFFNMSIIVISPDGNRANYNYTLYLQPKKKLTLNFIGKERMGLTALYEKTTDSNNRALLRLNEKSAQELASLYRTKVELPELKKSLFKLLNLAEQAATTDGLEIPVKEYLMMQGYNLYISNLYRFGMEYKISTQDSAFYTLPEEASSYFNHKLFTSFYEAPSNLINSLDIAIGLKPYSRRKSLEQLEAQIELLNHKTNKPSTKNLIIERLLAQYISGYRIGSDFEKDLEHFSLLAKKATATETQNTLITSFENLKYTLVGAHWPLVNIQDTSGNWISLEKFKGKYLFVDLWASWCAPCIKMTPYVKALEEKFKDSNISFVAISIDNQPDKWKAKLQELNLEEHQYIDEKGDLARQLNVSGIPHYLLYSPEGKLLIYKMDMPNDPKVAEMLSKLLQ